MTRAFSRQQEAGMRHRTPLATDHPLCHLHRMSDRLADWWADYVAPVVRWWLGDRESPRCLEVRAQALHARTEDDSRRLREHAAQAAADAAEDAHIRQMQAEIRQLAELRRQQRADGPR